jgi:hypothetical protein
MSTQLIETVTEETTNLVLHVQLCEQRYLQLLNKFDQVDVRLDQMCKTLEDIRGTMSNQQNHTLQTYLAWAGVIIVSLGGTVLHLISR